MPDILGPLKGLGEALGHHAGDEMRRRVMEGAERLSDSSSPAEIAEWVKGAMGRMDDLLDEDTRIRVREQCGYNCARINRRPIEAAVRRRMKHASLGKFLDAEEGKPPRGTRLEREGDILYFCYTPGSFRRSLRCYCGLLRGLPEDRTVSLTYCQCSKGFVERYWEAVLGRPVRVDLLHSCAAGAEECRFAVHL